MLKWLTGPGLICPEHCVALFPGIHRTCTSRQLPTRAVFPGIHTIFRRNPFTFAAILLPFGLEIRVLVSGLLGKTYTDFSARCGPDLGSSYA